MTEIRHLLALQFRLGAKRSTDIYAVVLFLLATAFTIYMGFQRMRSETWIVLFWVVMLFVSASQMSASMRIFGGREKHYFFQLSNPINLFLSRVIVETIFLTIYSLLLFVVFSLFFGTVFPMNWQWFLLILLGALSFSSAFTFVSALLSNSGQGNTYVALLSFPLLIPSILLLVHTSYQVVGLLESHDLLSNWLTLIGVDAVLLGLGIILFPIIWRS